MSNSELIELEKICHLYEGIGQSVQALTDISLTIGKGEFVAVTGASGSGKTTLLHIMGCLLRPTSGSYCLNGLETSKISSNNMAEIRNKTFGFVFQTANLLPRASVLNNVRLPHKYAGMKRNRSVAKAKELLRRVGLKHRMTHMPNQLSGGEQQRVAIARALANQPQILFADEPTGSLDIVNSAIIMELFGELIHDGMTVVMVTHNKELVQYTKREISLNGRHLVD